MSGGDNLSQGVTAPGRRHGRAPQNDKWEPLPCLDPGSLGREEDEGLCMCLL